MRGRWVLLLTVLAAAWVLSPVTLAEEMGEGRIAFVSGDSDGHEIMTMNADGSDVRQVTSLGKDCHRPVWSPDGTRIAFQAYRRSSRRSAEICVIDADGNNMMWLTDDKSFDGEPCWSPDGTKILFVSERQNPSGEIYIMDADGSNVVRLTKNGYRESNPCFSPDGTKIAYSAMVFGSLPMVQSIYVMNADGSEVKRLTITPLNLVEPKWSPDGSRIACCTWFDPYNKSMFNIALLTEGGIRVMDADGENERHVYGTVSGDSSPTWSPGGRVIAFRRTGRWSIYEIYLAYPDETATEPVNITNSKSGEMDPDWSRQ